MQNVLYAGGDAGTGELWRDGDPDRGNLCSGDYLQRSTLTDGRRSVLLLHLLLHAGAMACTAVGAGYAIQNFANHQIYVLASLAMFFEALGIVLTLIAGSVVRSESEWVITKTVTYGAFFLGLLLTIALYTLTINVNAHFSTEHIMLTIGIPLQTLALSMVIALSLNLAANGGSPDHPDAAPGQKTSEFKLGGRRFETRRA